MNNDNIRAAEWRKSVLDLFQKLPQYNEKDFAFEIDVGHENSQEREQYYFVEKGEYFNYFYDWRDVSKKSTKNIEEAIYWILQDRIFNYVIQYEKEHRIRYVDGRRQWFKLEQEMYDTIGKPYSEIKRKEQAKILRKNPFDDAPACRLNLLEDYDKIEQWIKKSEYNDMSQYHAGLNKLLALWRGKIDCTNIVIT